MTIHTGEKPYKCRFCDELFSSQYYLKVHDSIHTGDNIFNCSHCDKTFTHSITLKSHTILHQIFKCSQCKEDFPGLRSLRHHKCPNVSEGKAERCNVCFKDLNNISDPKMHIFRCKKTKMVLSLQEVNQKQEDITIKQENEVKRESPIKVSGDIEEGELIDCFEEREKGLTSENINPKETIKCDINKEQKQKHQEKNEKRLKEHITIKDREQKEKKKQDRGQESLEHNFDIEDVRRGNILNSDEQKTYNISRVLMNSVWTCRICGRSARGHLNHTCMYCFSPL